MEPFKVLLAACFVLTGKVANLFEKPLLMSLALDLHYLEPGMWKRLFRQPLPFPLTKNEKTTVDNFFNFCGSVACLLLYFFILGNKNLCVLLLLYLLRLNLLFRTTLCFFFLDIRTRVECRTVFLSSRNTPDVLSRLSRNPH